MRRDRVVDERLLMGLRRRRFERCRFVGQDATAVTISDTEPLPPEIQAIIDGGRPIRIYPVEGGYRYKWRHSGSSIAVEGSEREPRGWDHEHCDACERIISIGKTAWLTKRSPYYGLCPYCYRRIGQLIRHNRPRIRS